MLAWWRLGVGLWLAAFAVPVAAASYTLQQALGYPFVSELVAAERADRIAWVRTVRGVRNIWVASAPGWTPRAVTQFTADDGQELTNLVLSPDGTKLVFVRGGDHDANWPAAGGLAPAPASTTEQAKIILWAADPSGGRAARPIGEGDFPALSATGQLAYLRDQQVWTAKLDGSNARRLFFDRGKNRDLVWSPDGSRLAFVSTRDANHSFVGIYTAATRPLTWLSPSTGFDGDPVWSPDGRRVAFTRRPGAGGAPEPLLVEVPQPWSIWTADATSGAGTRAWASPATLRGSYPGTWGPVLRWAAGDTLTFIAEMDNWQHLYAVPAAGGTPRLLTPGGFMVEHVALSRDRRALIYSANAGTTPNDDDRRHLFRVAVADGATVALTRGDGLEWAPVAAGETVAFVAADARRPPAVELIAQGGGDRRVIGNQAPPPGFPGAQFVTPRAVTFKAPDGEIIHGQLFVRDDGAPKKPGVAFVHGGPPRQMLLGWHYMGYYAHAYALNQYLADHGFAVLAVNYRLGIGYGRDFQHPERGGPAGSSEYQDVAAAGRYLAGLPGVDPARIGLWGGSYGGLLTALGLARDSKLFKAGVDLHGVHDWSRILAEELPSRAGLYEQGDLAKATETAFKASPVADIDTWKSPVLLIHGDDDRNVRFNQTVDLANRLRARGVDFEELVLPDEIHDFLRYEAWLKADRATAGFLARRLGGESE